MRPRTPTFATSLSEDGLALRRLAEALLGAGGEAEDAVQQTFVAALAAPSRIAAFVSPWLTSTVRRIALTWRRAALRRRHREHAAATPEADRATDPAAIAIETERVERVAQAVRALPDPFREVVVLRFWRGLTPQAIAAELAIPRNTVRSRLQRGLARLRAQLDAEYGDRAAWSVPIGFVVGGLRASGAIMVKKVTVVCVAITLVGLMGWLFGASRDDAATRGADAAVASVAVADTVSPATVQAMSGVRTMSTRAERVVVDAASGVGVAVELQLRATGAAAIVQADQFVRADAAGMFVLPAGLPPGSYELRSVCGPRVVGGGAFTIVADQPEPQLRVLVAASRSDQVRGVVRDVADGRPLADVVVRGREPGGALFVATLMPTADLRCGPTRNERAKSRSRSTSAGGIARVGVLSTRCSVQRSLGGVPASSRSCYLARRPCWCACAMTMATR